MIFHGYDPALAQFLAGEDAAVSGEAEAEERRLLPLGVMLLSLSLILLFALT